jgi:outer membrane biosynthesis protein TonB
MKKKKLVLKKKPKAGENTPDAPAPVAPLEVHVTTPIPSGPVKSKKGEVKIEKSKDDDGSDKAAAAAAKLQRERDEAAVSKREGGDAGGSGKGSFWDDLPSF